ncbi:MAG: hypothetical protein AB2L22_13180 [Syntrophales bacterium]
MEASYDAIPVAYRVERLGRMKDLVLQMEADYAHFQELKLKMEGDGGTKPEREDFLATVVRLKREMIAYRRLREVSIEGVTYAGIGDSSL